MFKVSSILVCPKYLATSVISAPLLINKLAHECLKSCNLIIRLNLKLLEILGNLVAIIYFLRNIFLHLNGPERGPFCLFEFKKFKLGIYIFKYICISLIKFINFGI